MSDRNKNNKNDFPMILGNNNSLHCIQMINARRDLLSQKILRGIVTKDEILTQLISEYQIYSKCAEKIFSKNNHNKPLESVNDILPGLTNRINSMWNDMYLLFTVEYDIVPEYIDLSLISTAPLANISETNEVFFNRLGAIATQSIDIDASRFTTSGIRYTRAIRFPPPDFIGILQETSFVDKTLLIKELFRPDEHRAILVTAPRKYGRTTMVSMLKYFLEIQIDSAGKPLTKARGDDAVVDTSNYALFRGTKIFREGDIMARHFGKHPVLHVEFTNASVQSLNAIISSCKEIVHECFKWHDYLKHSAALSEGQKTKCRTWCDEKAYKKLKNPAVAYGLKSLCKYMTKHYGKPCFVLLDGHDTMTMPTVMARDWCDKTNKIYDFIGKMLLFLKLDDAYFGRAFITGKSSMASSGILPQCVKMYKFAVYHKYNEYYGFTPTEVRYLFDKPEFAHLRPMYKDLQCHYGGYNKLNYELQSTKQMFCMWSILSVLKRNVLENYWKEFGNFFCTIKAPTIQPKIHTLLHNGSILIEEYDTSTRVFSPKVLDSATKKKTVHFFFNYLLDIGYLTCIRHRMSENNPYKNSKVLHIKIPNIEVRLDLAEKLRVLY